MFLLNILYHMETSAKSLACVIGEKIPKLSRKRSMRRIVNILVSNKCQGVSDHSQYDFVVNSLYILKHRNHQSSPLLTIHDGNPSMNDGVPTQMASSADNVSVSWHLCVLETVSFPLFPAHCKFNWHKMILEVLLGCILTRFCHSQ